MSAPHDDTTVLSEASGRASVSEVVETTVGALIAVDASDSPADDARGVRGDELEEWFARAASGAVSDEGDRPARELVGAATLPPHDAVVRPRTGSMRTPGAGLCCRARGRALALASFASLALLSVVVAVVMWSVGASLTSALVPEVVADANVSIDKLGDAVDRDLKVAIMRQKRADARRRAAAEAQRRRTIERRDRVRRRLLAARDRAVTRRRGTARARTFARTPASAVSSPRTRRSSSQARRGQFVSRRSSCGPFDLC
jgi:hypothetical protein